MFRLVKKDCIIIFNITLDLALTNDVETDDGLSIFSIIGKVGDTADNNETIDNFIKVIKLYVKSNKYIVVSEMVWKRAEYIKMKGKKLDQFNFNYIPNKNER